MKEFLTTTAIILLSLTLFGQRDTYFGIEVARTNDIYEFTDEGNTIIPIPLKTGLWGITIRQEINNWFSIESGLIRKYYNEGFGFEPPSPDIGSIGFSSDAMNVWQIPLRLKTQLNIYKNKIFFATNIGFHYCLNSDYGKYSWGEASFSYQTDTISTNLSSTSLAKSFFLLETGGGFEFKLFEKFLLAVSFNYMTGFKKALQLDFDYTVNTEITGNAYAHSKGEYWRLGLGLQYKISDIWTKKKGK